MKKIDKSIDHGAKAKELFQEGYNCSQSVLGAYAEELGMDMDQAMMLSSSFGAGMGRMREVCGAVSGMFMVAGLIDGFSSPKDEDAHKKKTEHYERIQRLAKKCIDANGSIICRELLGLAPKKNSLDPDAPEPEKRTEAYYKKRPCAELCAMAASFIESEFADN